MKKDLTNELSNRLEIKSRRMGATYRTASQTIKQSVTIPIGTLSHITTLHNTTPTESWRADILDFGAINNKIDNRANQSFDISDYEDNSYALLLMIKNTKNRKDSVAKASLRGKGLWATPLSSIPLYEYHPSPNLWQEMEAALTNLYVERTNGINQIDPTRCAPIKLSL